MATRDEKGRWIKGAESPNPAGRSKRETERDYLNALKTAVTLSDLKEVAQALVRSGKRGNTAAIKVLFEYLIPKPAQEHEISGKDGGAIPLELFSQAVRKVYGETDDAGGD